MQGRSIHMWRAMAVALGALQAWGCRYQLYPDTISYLDIGDEFLAGRWRTAFNAHWSVGYSWLVGIWVRLFGGASEREILALHALNFVIYLLTLAAFEYLLRGMCRMLQARANEARPPLTPQLLTVIAYPLLIWTALDLVSMSDPTPDMLVAFFVLLAAGSLTRLAIGERPLLQSLLCGAYLGLGYWSKNVMFPISLMFLAGLGVESWRRRRLIDFGISTAVFCMVAAVVIVPLSWFQGRPTFGDSGKLNYAWHVNGVKAYGHWLGEDGDLFGHPTHPPRRILAHPSVYEFGTPLPGTYPIYFDPVYWYEGVRPRFDARQQLDRIMAVARDTMRAFFVERSLPWGSILIAYLTAALAIASTSGHRGESWGVLFKALRDQLYLLLPSLAVVAMFCCVYMLPRYVGPFVFLVLFALVASIRLPGPRSDLRYLVVATAAALWAYQGIQTVRSLAGNEDHRTHCEIAAHLQRLGLRPGDPVAHVGNSYRAYWARLGKMRIISEIRPEHAAAFLEDATARAQAVDVIRKTGARCIVASRLKRAPGPESWEEVVDGYWVLML